MSVMIGLAVLAMAGAPPPPPPLPPHKSVQQALVGDSGLGIIGPDTPKQLQVIALAPYALPEPLDCEVLAAETAQLNQLLGPDLDVPEDKRRQLHVERYAVNALRGFVPYRGVMRWVAGSSAKDRVLARATLAGAARRGYLKGIAHGLMCAQPDLSSAPKGSDRPVLSSGAEH